MEYNFKDFLKRAPIIKQIMPPTKRESALYTEIGGNVWLDEIKAYGLFEFEDEGIPMTYVSFMVYNDDSSPGLIELDCLHQYVCLVDCSQGVPSIEEVKEKYKDRIKEVVDRLKERQSEMMLKQMEKQSEKQSEIESLNKFILDPKEKSGKLLAQEVIKKLTNEMEGVQNEK